MAWPDRSRPTATRWCGSCEAPPTPARARVRWDIERGEIDAAGLEGLDGVVHLAGEGIGEKRWTDEQKRKILESRTKGTGLLADALASLDAKPPVLVSGRRDRRLRRPRRRAAHRGERARHRVPRRGRRRLGGRRRARRGGRHPGATHPHRDRPRRRTAACSQRLARLCRFGILGKLGSGKQWMSWISLADEVAAIRFLLAPELRPPRPGQPHRAGAGHQRGVHQGARPGAAPADVPPGARASARSCSSDPSWPSRCSTRASECSPTCSLDAGFEFRHTDLEPTLRDLLG